MLRLDTRKVQRGMRERAKGARSIGFADRLDVLALGSATYSGRFEHSGFVGPSEFAGRCPRGTS